MPEWILIASADKNWGIGSKNHLLARVPEDMKHVSGKTRGNAIVMGRKTFESLPGGKPLPERINIVLTGSRDFYVDGVVVVQSIAELMDHVRDYHGQLYVFGGESIYRQLLPYCTRACITRFREAYQADTFLPCFDDLEGWEMVYSGQWQTSKTGVCFRFTEYSKEM